MALSSDSEALRLVATAGDLAAGDQELADVFAEELGASPDRPVVLDLSQVGMINSQAIGKIVSLYRGCADGGRAFAVDVATEGARRTFTMLSLDKVFTVNIV